jgi:hypothetical protein
MLSQIGLARHMQVPRAVAATTSCTVQLLYAVLTRVSMVDRTVTCRAGWHGESARPYHCSQRSATGR